MAEEKTTALANLFSDAVLLAVITAMAYWFAFRYEASYLGFFGIPPYLTQIQLNSILLAALSVSGALFSVLVVANVLSPFWPTGPLIRLKLVRVLLYWIYSLWHLLNYGFRKEDWIVYVIPIVFTVIFEFLFPIISHRDKASLREKFISYEVREAQAEPLIGDRIYEVFGPAVHSLVILLFLGTFLSSVAGRAAANTQKNFLLLSDKPNVAILRIYPELLIAMPFNPKTKELDRRLIIRRGDSEEIHFTLSEEIGPLKLKKYPKTDSLKEENPASKETLINPLTNPQPLLIPKAAE